MLDLPKYWVYTFVIGCAILLVVLGWFTLFAPLFNQADYNSFNSSPTHLQAVAGKFSDDCLQIAESKNDTVAVKALEQDIYQNAEGVRLQNVSMPDGVRSCVNKAINDVTDGQ